MKQLLIIALACYGLRSSAQVQESRNFLYLYSDSVIYAKDIKLRPDFAGNMRIRVDSRSFPTAQVKFFSSKEGFFANTRKLGIMKYGDFSERIVEGRINVFQERKLSYSHFIYDANSNPHFIHNPEPSININMYYNKGYGDLKKLNYKNLKNDIADNPESIEMLYAYRKSMNTSNVLYTAASISIIAGIISVISNGKNSYSKTNFTTGLSLAVVGLGFATGGYLNSVSAGRKLEDAIDIYNR
ncbi:MAG: hypothetical protein WC623_12465 [Pedobacter sp.]|uniref:hypothetical protein n=1 Tax=Pedobacter sp. TaxID=1411316 RepID=UPI003567ADED